MDTATVTGAGTGTYNDLTLGLASGGTFTKLQLNPGAKTDGNINFAIRYLTGNGFWNTANFLLNGGGQNWFTIDAINGAAINSASYSTTDTQFADSSQLRIGGAATANVPDATSTIGVLALGLLMLGVHRKLIA
jgi:hypothetical protein